MSANLEKKGWFYSLEFTELKIRVFFFSVRENSAVNSQ